MDPVPENTLHARLDPAAGCYTLQFPVDTENRAEISHGVSLKSVPADTTDCGAIELAVGQVVLQIKLPSDEGLEISRSTTGKQVSLYLDSNGLIELTDEVHNLRCGFSTRGFWPTCSPADSFVVKSEQAFSVQDLKRLLMLLV